MESAATLAKSLGAKCILVFTATGGSAWRAARASPRRPPSNAAGGACRA